ncbi:MAG TPA: cation diffusion facilitator family transporter [Mariprofundaceae bacterium]|nr:cation diffusion facilitator family transporter [Mariprofundaceae bacterium]
MNETTLTQEQKARLMRQATYASTATASVLIVAKLIAWLMSDSVSLLATLIDSSLDVLASILNLLAVRHALTPADKQHRFGHGKAEALAGLGQATFIAGSAAFLFLEAISRFLHPVEIHAVGVGVIVMVLSIAATIGLMIFQNHVIRMTDSTAIKADALHYKTDLLVNGSVIAALLLATYGWAGFDAVFGLAIAFYIIYSAWEIVREALDHLMDKELPAEERDRIEQIVRRHPDGRGMHDLRTRQAGTTVFIQLHLELDDELTLLQAHRIADEVEAELMLAYPGAEVIIHEDPVGLNEPRPDFVEDAH